MNDILSRTTDSLGNTIEEVVVDKKRGDININDLPIELLINIFSRLDLVQLNSLRLVCRNWNNAVLYRSTWTKSFSLRFGSGDIFPSLTNGNSWITEYYARLKVLKKWKRSTSTHRNYQLLNNEYGYIDHSLVSSSRNKLLTFSALDGNIAICNLDSGKNQAFIPGNDVFTQITSFAIDWTFVLIGKRTGELYLKNHVIASTSGSNRLSLTKLIDYELSGNDPITATALNPSTVKYKEGINCMSGSFNGKLKLWDFDNKLCKEISLNRAILDVQSDFKRVIVCLTTDVIYIYDLIHFNKTEIPLDFQIIDNNKAFMDVDYGDCNIILSYENQIRVFNFKDLNLILTREYNFTQGEKTRKVAMQSIPPSKLLKRDVTVAGADGLFYANVLSDDTVFVWNLRDLSKEITPQCRISPVFSKYAPRIPHDLPKIHSVELNSSVICIGGYNRFTNLHNVFTGDFIRECSGNSKSRSEHLIPVSKIHLNEDQTASNGIIICGDSIQYFQFGAIEKILPQFTKKKLNNGPTNKLNKQIQIKNAMEDYDLEMERERQQNKLFDKYNGDALCDDDDISIALAISASYQQSNNNRVDKEEEVDEELVRAIAMSESEQLNLNNPESDELDEEEQLRRVLEMSLIDQ